MIFRIEDVSVYFPYDNIYREQYEYMVELKRAPDAKGHCLLEMPTGTGKTIALLSLITSYRLSRPESPIKLVYCTRTVHEMEKTLGELKILHDYQVKLLGDQAKILAIGLSSRKNLCINPKVVAAENRDSVDAACRKRTATWVREMAAENPNVELCDYFENYEKAAENALLPSGVYTLEETDAGRLRAEYNRLVEGLAMRGDLAGGDQWLANPALPHDILKEAVPGNIRRTEHFVHVLRRLLQYLGVRLDTENVQKESPVGFVSSISSQAGIDQKTLKFCYDRLHSLMLTLEITDTDELLNLMTSECLIFQILYCRILLARLEYLLDTFQIKEGDFLTFDALRQAAQSVGRVIRSKADYGMLQAISCVTWAGFGVLELGQQVTSEYAVKRGLGTHILFF